MPGPRIDLLVLGGGAGGIAAARAGVRKGANVSLVQHGPVGGECTFSGCVPSKALIEAAAAGASFETAIARVHRAITTIAAAESAEVLAGEGIEVVGGYGSLTSPRTIEVGGRSLSADRMIIATGAGPVVPPIEGLSDIDYLTNENLWDLRSLPASLAILGGGAIGVELAQAFARLGSEVTLIEGQDRLLPREEPEASAVLAQVFREEGIDLQLGQLVTRVEATGGSGAGAAGGSGAGGVRLHLSGGGTVEAARIVVAVGRKPRTTGFGLEVARVVTDAKGFVVTDDHLATTTKGIWAVGDV
ncbi:MAG: FAD-dependent oxidoreductase, partial [Acidimicrobiales bacterium]